MKKVRQADGTLSPCYRVANMIRRHDEIIELSVPDGFEGNLIILFQGHPFRFIEAVESLENCSDIEEVEFLPGIYLSRKHMTITDSIMDKLIKKNRYVIRNQNYRDAFAIESVLEYPKLVAQTYDSSDSDTSIEYVNPAAVEQPYNLGGGKCGGCPVVSSFDARDINRGRNSFDEYNFWSEKELVAATCNEEFYLQLCRGSKCFQTYKSIIEDGYIEELKDCDQIKISTSNGSYIAGEGKHRICAMRRFGSGHDIPMLVSRAKEEIRLCEESAPTNYWSMKHVKESFYSICKDSMGVDKETARKLLHNSEATIVDYLRASELSVENR